MHWMADLRTRMFVKVAAHVLGTRWTPAAAHGGVRSPARCNTTQARVRVRAFLRVCVYLDTLVLH